MIFLIYPSDLLRVKSLLVAQGFVAQFALDDQRQLRYSRQNYEEWFRQPTTGLMVDLHWSLLPPAYSFSPDPALAWQNPASVDLGNGPVETFAPAILLLYLTAHGAKHNWESWQLVSDLAHLLQSEPGLDWDWLTRHAKSLGGQPALRLGLYLAHHLLDARLPPSILAELATDPALPPRLSQVRSRLYAWPTLRSVSRQGWPGQYWRGLTDWFNRDRLYRQVLPTRLDYLRYWRDNLFVPTPLEWARLPLPTFLFPLYYVVRPVRLVLKYLRRKQAGP